MDKKNTKIKERILYIADIKQISYKDFLESVDLKYANFKGKQKETGINSLSIEKIISEYPDINLSWLITGKGNPITEDRPIVINENSPNSNNFSISKNKGDIFIPYTDISKLIELQKENQEERKELNKRLEKSQSQIDTLLEILKTK